MKKIFGLFFTVALGGVIYFFLFTPPNLTAPETEKIIVIKNGQGLREIAQVLKENNYIRSIFGFEILAWLKGVSNKLQAGEYKLPARLSLNQLLDYLSKGIGIQKEREIRIIEGWTLQEIANYLEKEGLASKDEFFKLVGLPALDYRETKEKAWPKDFSSEFEFLKDKPSYLSYEGYLFPDTYRIYKNAPLEEIIRKMFKNFDRKLTPEMRLDIKRRGRTIFDIVRMASIIEAEVPHSQDRPIVSDILWKRLERGMLLQVDSTLNYFTGNKSSALSEEELKIDSLYNTYKYPGLPPTPISNPGLEALKAAIYPQKSPYWYFLSTPEGKTIFSKTLEEHKAAKAKYLK
jgi:UPF0755 protein